MKATKEDKEFAMEVLGSGSGWKWCLHCERVYKKDEIKWDEESEIFKCAYDDCDGDVFGDAWDFEKEIQAGWVENPQKGVVYPLYEKNN